MAKYRPAGRKARTTAPRGGIPCVILLAIGFALVLFFLYFVLKYASQ